MREHVCERERVSERERACMFVCLSESSKLKHKRLSSDISFRSSVYSSMNNMNKLDILKFVYRISVMSMRYSLAVNIIRVIVGTHIVTIYYFFVLLENR